MRAVRFSEVVVAAGSVFEGEGGQDALSGEPGTLVEEVFDVGFLRIGKKSAGFVLQFLRDVKADVGP